MKNENFKCTKCGNSELHVFNVPYSEKRHSLFVGLMIVACVVLCLFWTCQISNVLSSLDSEKKTILSSIYSNELLGIFMLQALLDTIVALVMFIVFYILLPYKNRNVTEYFCPYCGRQAPVSEMYGEPNSY